MSIKVDNISFKYNKSKPYVLENFSAEFSCEKITAITGKNGCGKTTLSRIIMGILKPEEGKVTINGKDVSQLTLAETGRKIGYVMQNPAKQIFSTSVLEEMEYNLENIGVTGEVKKTRIKKYLEYFDLQGKERDFPFHLSHGEKQRLVLAAILSMEPSWIMLDEPTAALDYQRKDKLGEYLLKLQREKGCGIIIISHDKEFVEKYANEVLHV